MKRTALVLATTFIILSGCSNTQNAKDTNAKEYTMSTYITDEIRSHSEQGTLEAISTVEYSPATMLSYASDVALVKVISVDSADMDFTAFVPTTYGKLFIDTVLIGDVSENQIINYAKPGGFVSIAEYEKKDDPEAIAKRDKLREEAGIEIDKNKQYYDMKLEADIEIEAGKTYLAYMTYHAEIDKYEIIGLGNGLREVDQPIAQDKVKAIKSDVETAKIKNNTTGTYESLAEYIETYLKK